MTKKKFKKSFLLTFINKQGEKRESTETRGKESIRTGLECSTVKKSGLVRNLALGDCSSRARRDRELA